MKIQNDFSPKFGAKFINHINAGKFVPQTKRYSDVQLSFVKIEPDNPADIDALAYAANYWMYDKFAKNIYYAACAIRNGSKYYKNNEVYALTSQNSDYTKPDGTKLLGLVHLSPSHSSMLIERIQVNPDMLYSCNYGFTYNTNQEYRGLGTAILNSLKWLYDCITCNPASEKSVKGFYYKNDFKPNPNNIDQLVWSKHSKMSLLNPIDKPQLLLISK